MSNNNKANKKLNGFDKASQPLPKIDTKLDVRNSLELENDILRKQVKCYEKQAQHLHKVVDELAKYHNYMVTLTQKFNDMTANISELDKKIKELQLARTGINPVETIEVSESDARELGISESNATDSDDELSLDDLGNATDSDDELSLDDLGNATDSDDELSLDDLGNATDSDDELSLDDLGNATDSDDELSLDDLGNATDSDDELSLDDLGNATDSDDELSLDDLGNATDSDDELSLDDLGGATDSDDELSLDDLGGATDSDDELSLDDL